jgi:DNA-binding Lrp family transcriptional regulator
MAIRAYVLIEAEVGRLRDVGQAMAALAHPHAQVLTAETVTGPYDVIALLHADDLDRLGQCVVAGIQAIPGVKRTTTCLAIGPG